MTVRNGGAAAFASRRLPAKARHLGRHAGLIDEDELRRIKTGLTAEPFQARKPDVVAILFAGVCGLFLNVIPRRSKKRQMVAGQTRTPCSASSFDPPGWPLLRAALRRSPASADAARPTSTLRSKIAAPQPASTCPLQSPRSSDAAGPR